MVLATVAFLGGWMAQALQGFPIAAPQSCCSVRPSAHPV